MRRFFAKLYAFVRRGRIEEELAREVASHLGLIEDDFARRGMSRVDAQLAARRAYGGIDQAKEMHRDERSFVWLEQILQDVRHASRSLAKSRGFAAVALFSLAFGIGANTAIFTLVNGILLKTLPVPEPHRVVQVYGQFKDFDTKDFNYPVFREVRRETVTFLDLIGFSSRQAMLNRDGDAHPVALQLVTGSYFSFFGARPALGRLLDEEDDRVEGARAVCVIGHKIWRTYFGRDPKIIGRTIHLGSVPFQVVGVAPEQFIGPELQEELDVWVPTAMLAEFGNRRESTNYIYLGMMGRLKPGISLTEANARIAAAGSTIEERLPKGTARANPNPTYQLRDASKGADAWRTRLHDPLLILMTTVSLVLLVACANLANLLLARAGERQREFAVKLSLGISRGRLIRQLLIEALLLAFAGGAAALLIATKLTAFLLALFNQGKSRVLYVEPDWNVLLFTTGACVLTALIAGLYPAWQASRTDAAPALKDAPIGGMQRSFVRRSLILVQVTLAVVLLFGASLFTHSLRQLKTVELGFDMERVLTVQIHQSGRPNPVKSPAALADVLARTLQLPGVESAALSDPPVLSGGMMAGGFAVTDSSGVKRDMNSNIMFAQPGYMSLMRIPILRGRDFSAADRPGAPVVALANQKLAEQLAKLGAEPMGFHIPEVWGEKNVEIAGIVGNSKYQGVRESDKPILYLPFDQMRVTGGGLQVRYRGSLAQAEREIRQIVKSAAPGYQVTEASSLEQIRDSRIAQDRLLTFLSTLFGALGATLAIIGIYGLISYAVTRRTREIGIRMSVGAQRGDVLWMFLRESSMLVAGGIVLGLPIALALARFIEKMLFRVTASDPFGIAATLALMLLGGLAASYVPGRRATRVDPVQALRSE